MARAADVIYLYGIAPGDAAPPAGLLGLRAAGLCALCARVPAEFGDAKALEHRLCDPAFVVPLAERHEATLRLIRQTAPVLPARLCTVFSGEPAVRALLRRQAAALRVQLERIAGREEYAVKVYCDRARLIDRIAADGADDAALSPGLRYLAAARRRTAASAAAEARMDQVCGQVEAALFPYADALRDRPLLPPGAAGRPEPMILNLALLCTPAGAARVKAVLESLEEAVGAEGFVLQRGGPFTPYSFAAGVEDGGPGAAPRSSKEEAHDAVLA